MQSIRRLSFLHTFCKTFYVQHSSSCISTHTLKTGHMFIWTYLFGIVHTTTSYNIYYSSWNTLYIFPAAARGSYLHNVCTSSGAHVASCSVDMYRKPCSSERKGRVVKMITHNISYQFKKEWSYTSIAHVPSRLAQGQLSVYVLLHL